MRQVKRFESGIVMNPVTIPPDATLGEALAIMKAKGINGLPVVADSGPNGNSKSGSSWYPHPSRCALRRAHGPRFANS